MQKTFLNSGKMKSEILKFLLFFILCCINAKYFVSSEISEKIQTQYEGTTISIERNMKNPSIGNKSSETSKTRLPSTFKPTLHTPFVNKANETIIGQNYQKIHEDESTSKLEKIPAQETSDKQATINDQIQNVSTSTTIFKDEVESTTDPTTESSTMDNTTTEPETTEITSNAPPPNCKLENITHELTEDNILNIKWNINDIESCTNETVRVTKENCKDSFNSENCTESIEVNAYSKEYIFVEPLVPCVTYDYQVQLINSQEKFNASVTANRKYNEITNLKIMDEEDEENNKILNMIISWDYAYPKCKEFFEVSARSRSYSNVGTIQNLTYKAEKVPACEELNVTVSIKDQPTYFVSQLYTTKRVDPSPIRNVTVVEDDSSITLSWEDPEYGNKCIKQYMIHAKNVYGEILRNTTSTSSTFSNIYACTNYSITLSTFSSNNNDEKSEVNEASETINIETKPRIFAQPQQPQLTDSSDTTLTFELIPSDEPRNMCPIIQYHIQCILSETETKYNGSNSEKIVKVENLVPYRNYSCSASLENQENEISVWSSQVNFATNPSVKRSQKIIVHPSKDISIDIKPTDCVLRDISHNLSEETNVLTINWETNESVLCDTGKVNISLTDENCRENFENNSEDSCTVSSKVEVASKTHTFTPPLTPCIMYQYRVHLINSDKVFNASVTANRKYNEITNLTIMEEEDAENNKILNMLISWDYIYPACRENFEVSARSQGNNFASTIQSFSYKISGVPACEQFNITVSIKDQPTIFVSQLYTMKRVDPSPIRNFTVSQEDDNSILLLWAAPEYGDKCIKRYIIIAKNEYNETQRNATSTSYKISEVYSCTNYNITLSTFTSTIDDEDSYTTLDSFPNLSTTEIVQMTTDLTSISPAKAEKTIEVSETRSIKTEPRTFIQPQQPQLEMSSDTKLTLRVVPSLDDNNKCPVIKYHIQCISNVNNDTFYGKNSTNIVKVDGLEPFHLYSCSAQVENEKGSKSSWSYPFNFTTQEGVPDAPLVKILDETITSTSFTITWNVTNAKGLIKQYVINTKFMKFLYDNPPYCSQNSSSQKQTLPAEGLKDLEYTFKEGVPGANYNVQVQVINQAFDGDFSESMLATTKEGHPDAISFTIIPNKIILNEPYNKTISVELSYPCHANGFIRGFQFVFESVELGYPVYRNILYEKGIEKYKYSISIDELEPDVNYAVSAYAYTESFNGTVTSRDFMLNAGIPIPDNKIIMEISRETSTTSAYISIPEKLFESNVGEITQIKIFVGQWNCEGMESQHGFKEDEEKYKVPLWEEAIKQECIPVYDTGLEIKKPDEKNRIGIGTEQMCELGRICNGRLRPGTTYGIAFRLYTSTGFSDTEYIKFITKKEVPIVAISIIILSILCLVFLIGFYISCRRTQALRKSAVDSPYDRKDISIQNFPSYHVVMSNNDCEKIKEEYRAIQYFSENLDKTYIASRANEKLNRYINIYPYDSTRVVLNDDEYENDYINASYINGYYYPKEYIAAQGPKPDTVLDFWRMALQHRVESIVMLTSFVEDNKIKCHEYFPKLNGHITCGNITVKCIKEEKFASYIKRVLQVKKDDVLLNINHYFYCVWPDHGCPSNALDLIEFIKVVRSERERPGETYIVHCSAGVGRTGTFIALDIIIQRIKKEGKINIFDLVKQLRIQRMKMVQSCDQYIFLYTASLELVNMSRSANGYCITIFQNLRDTVLKCVNEIELPKACNWRENRANERNNIVKTGENETPM